MKQQHQQSNKQVQKQGYYLSQHHLRLMHLLHLSGFALQEYIANEIEQNPALELEFESLDQLEEDQSIEDNVFDPDLFSNDDDLFEKSYNQSQSGKEVFYEAPVIHYSSLNENLKDQIHHMRLKEGLTDITCYLIDELDDDGYLRRSLNDVSFDYGFTFGKLFNESDFEDGLKVLQTCDPVGIGARDLKECLVLQLRRKIEGDHVHPLLKKCLTILEDCYELFVQRKFGRIMEKTHLNEEELNQALHIIRHLNPKPVTETNKYELMLQQIIPEFELSFDEEQIYVSFSHKDATKLKVNASFDRRILKVNGDTETNQVEKYYSELINDAQNIVDALKERESTMMKVISEIASVQIEFFKTGDIKDLKPMILQDISANTGFDISTISRITSNKHIQTPHGIYALRNLFMRNINPNLEQNTQNTALGIKEEIKKIIAEEDKSKPYLDSEIANLLKDIGIQLARRTVVKYREALGIPNSTLRKEMAV
ncbi:RNA polymerase factor sigma-54 [soil metagenome]